MLITLLTVLLASSLVSAQTAVINFTDHGWYTESGVHRPSNPNYIVGDDRGSGGESDYRNFFVFDLSGVTEPISSAKLAVYVPGGQYTPGYQSPDPSENYELHDVVTPIASLIDGTGGVAAHTDLGSGVVFGSRTMTPGDKGKVVEITLNSSAIAVLNSSHGLFGIGGSLTTLDGAANTEVVFSYSGGGSTDIAQLRLTLLPEPSTLLLLGIGAISLLGYRKAKT